MTVGSNVYILFRLPITLSRWLTSLDMSNSCNRQKARWSWSGCPSFSSITPLELPSLIFIIFRQELVWSLERIFEDQKNKIPSSFFQIKTVIIILDDHLILQTNFFHDKSQEKSVSSKVSSKVSTQQLDISFLCIFCRIKDLSNDWKNTFFYHLKAWVITQYNSEWTFLFDPDPKHHVKL